MRKAHVSQGMRTLTSNHSFGAESGLQKTQRTQLGILAPEVEPLAFLHHQPWVPPLACSFAAPPYTSDPARDLFNSLFPLLMLYASRWAPIPFPVDPPVLSQCPHSSCLPASSHPHYLAFSTAFTH